MTYTMTTISSYPIELYPTSSLDDPVDETSHHTRLTSSLVPTGYPMAVADDGLSASQGTADHPILIASDVVEGISDDDADIEACSGVDSRHASNSNIEDATSNHDGGRSNGRSNHDGRRQCAIPSSGSIAFGDPTSSQARAMIEALDNASEDSAREQASTGNGRSGQDARIAAYPTESYDLIRFKAQRTPTVSTAVDGVEDNGNNRKFWQDLGLVTLSARQAAAVELAVVHRRNIFITGPGGSGKSRVVGTIVDRLRRMQNPSVSVAVTATTGIAAVSIGGETVHRFAGVQDGKASLEVLKRRVRSSEVAVQRWRSTDVLVIDEISMMDSVLFTNLEAIARSIRKTDTPWGGMQLILVGDFFQLPPVIKPRPTANGTGGQPQETKGLAARGPAQGKPEQQPQHPPPPPPQQQQTVPDNPSPPLLFETRIFGTSVRYTVLLSVVYRQHDKGKPSPLPLCPRPSGHRVLWPVAGECSKLTRRGRTCRDVE
jgi:PIF1-like helicase